MNNPLVGLKHLLGMSLLSEALCCDTLIIKLLYHS